MKYILSQQPGSAVSTRLHPASLYISYECKYERAPVGPTHSMKRTDELFFPISHHVPTDVIAELKNCRCAVAFIQSGCYRTGRCEALRQHFYHTVCCEPFSSSHYNQKEERNTMEEPWDELMGPSPEDLKRMLNDDTKSQTAVRSAPSRPPPAGMFASSAVPPVSPNSSVASSSKQLAFEDEDDIPMSSSASVSSANAAADAIRQEALNVLRVADDRYQAQSSYSLTKTDGFSESKGKRVPSALRGMDFSSTARTKRYHDVPSVTSSKLSVEDYEYADQDVVVDVVGMDRRGMATRSEAESSSSKKWSSRYDVDNTLLSISMAKHNKQTLDQMDRDHTSRNLFNNSAVTAPKVFGSGFSFRKNNVFGKQNVTMKTPDANLQTVWMDMDGSSLPAPNTRNKSWQEQLDQKRRQRRCYIVTACVLCILMVALASIFGTKSHEKMFGKSNEAQIGTGPIEPGSVTFYVTSDGPYNLAAETNWRNELEKLSPQASFIVHLGNLQKAEETLCAESKYFQTAAFLKHFPITTFVLPGEEDTDNCPFPDRAFESWKDQFKFFHRHFGHLQSNNFEVMSEVDQYENFAIMHGGVLFLGMHVTGGRVYDRSVVDARNDYNYKWIEGMIQSRGNSVRAIVMLGNARPGEAQNEEFFLQMASYLASNTDKPVAYIHAGGSTTRVYTPFAQNDQLLVIQVGDSPLMRVNVGFGKRPFILG